MISGLHVMSRRTRGALLLGAFWIGVGLMAATALEPAPAGRGTHEQLGLPACQFASSTGRPCPGCGLTTSMAWMMRARIDRAFLANPAGCLLMPACVVAAPWMAHSAWTGRPRWGARSMGWPLMLLTVATASVALAAWSVRLFLGRV